MIAALGALLSCSSAAKLYALRVGFVGVMVSSLDSNLRVLSLNKTLQKWTAGHELTHPCAGVMHGCVRTLVSSHACTPGTCPLTPLSAQHLTPPVGHRRQTKELAKMPPLLPISARLCVRPRHFPANASLPAARGWSVAVACFDRERGGGEWHKPNRARVFQGVLSF